jgi:mannose-1-phosphate guanylyltransferase
VTSWAAAGDINDAKDASLEGKPDRQTATDYLNARGFYWNSGMFLFRASRYLEELKAYRSEIFEACLDSAAIMSPDLDFIRVDGEAFARCPSESIDYAVMENTAEGDVVPLDSGLNGIERHR